MTLDIAASTSVSRPNSATQKTADVSMDISTQLGSTTYNGKVELKGADVKITTDDGASATAAVSGAPPIVIAMDLLKLLSETQHKGHNGVYTGAALYKYDVG